MWIKKFMLFGICFFIFSIFSAVPSSAQKGQIVTVMIHITSLEGNLLEDSPEREITIYLPPSYNGKPDKHYPVVYLLHGYVANSSGLKEDLFITGDIKRFMDSWIQAGEVKEMILVMPNSFNRLGGSFYTNSVTTGNWADYIAKDLVKYIDDNYRTIPKHESRGVLGHSMGGYGAIKLGLLHPDVFSCICGLDGSFYGESSINNDSSSYARASTVESWDDFNKMKWMEQVYLAQCAAFIPNKKNPPFYCDFPFVYADSGSNKIVKNRRAYKNFVTHDILVMIQKSPNTLKGMRAIYLNCGSMDPFMNYARNLHHKLEELGIKHTYKEYSGSHWSGVVNHTGDALSVFSNVWN
jgi:enterochelin esterase-like enzyme